MPEGNSTGQTVAGLILAAGESSRMGKPKQLLPVKGMPLICTMVAEALASKLDKIVVVLGHQAQKIMHALENDGLLTKVRVVYNELYRLGMGTSIRAGMQQIERHCDHVMIILADMPHIDSNLINRLLTKYIHSGKDLGAVKIQGRRSHPVIFGKRYFPELLRLEGDTGGREIFAAHRDSALLVDAGPSYREIDLDTPEDYDKLGRTEF